MKILFLLSLLMNIVFFLWEFNSGALNGMLELNNDRNEAKQILLLSEVEVTNNKVNDALILATNMTANIVDLNETIISSELKALLKNGSKKEQSNVNSLGIFSAPKKNITFENISQDASELSVVPSNIVNNKSDVVQKITIKAKHQEDLIDQSSDVEENVIEPQASEKQADLEKEFCYKIGPFKTQNELDIWSEFNKIKVDLVDEQKVDSLEGSRFLVYFPAAESFSKSRENALMLKKKGITDFWLFRSGELKGMISLGLFVKKSRALSLQKKLTATGVNSEIIRRQKNESVFHARVITTDENFREANVFSTKQSVSECE